MHRYKPPLLPQRIKWEKKEEKKWPRCFAHTVDLCLSHQGPQFEKAISAGADHRGLLCWPRWEAGSEAQAAHSLVVRVLHRGVQLVAVTANTLSQIPGFTISGQPKGMPVPSLGNCAAYVTVTANTPSQIPGFAISRPHKATHVQIQLR